MNLEIRNLEILKWGGVVAMVVAHVGHYVVGGTNPIMDAVGTLALPLFAIALGAGLAQGNEGAGGRLLWRLLWWAVAAQFAVLFVRDVFLLTILTTLWLGVASCAVLRCGQSVLARSWKIGVFCLIGLFAEFSLAGVFFVFATVGWCCERTKLWAVAAVFGLLMLTPFNGSAWAFVALPLALVMGAVPRDFVRLRGVFYSLYVIQFPIFWAVKRTFF